MSVFGQNLPIKDFDNDHQLVLVLGKERYIIESETNLFIEHKWIKKIEILKIATEKHIYGNTFSGTIMIYSKRRYYKTIREKLKLTTKMKL